MWPSAIHSLDTSSPLQQYIGPTQIRIPSFFVLAPFYSPWHPRNSSALRKAYGSFCRFGLLHQPYKQALQILYLRVRGNCSITSCRGPNGGSAIYRIFSFPFLGRLHAHHDVQCFCPPNPLFCRRASCDHVSPQC
jgi:hypothetical protein